MATAVSPPVTLPGAHVAAPQTYTYTPNRPRIPAARMVAIADASAASLPLLLVLAYDHLETWPLGPVELLSAVRLPLGDLGLLVAWSAAAVLLFRLVGLYEAIRVRRRAEELARVAVAVTALVWLGTVTPPAAFHLDSAASTVIFLWTAGVVTVAAGRAVRAAAASPGARTCRALVVGSGPHALRICRELSVNPFRAYRVLGFVDTPGTPRSPFVTRRLLGELTELESILVREHVDEVHVGLPIKSHYPDIQDAIRVCERIGVKVVYGADLFETALARPQLAAVLPPRVELHLVTEGFPIAVKRAVDIVGASLALLLLAPVMAAAAAAVKLTSEGPIIFAQERYGLNRSRFRMLKFRTMVKDAERLQAALETQNEVHGPVFKIARDPRITRVGHFLRRTSIDELPQLFNVLRGEMSLVGPRPLPLRDVRLFTRSSDMRRFSVRPGITGLWQVSGRSMVDFDRWIVLDLHYIDHWSLALDIAILARTIPAVIRGRGAV